MKCEECNQSKIINTYAGRLLVCQNPQSAEYENQVDKHTKCRKRGK